MLWADADQYVQAILAHLPPLPATAQIEAAGSYRRGKETVGDLDFLVVAKDADAVMDHLAGYSAVGEVLARGDTKMSLRLASGFQVDLRVVPAESFGAALQYFTGSKQHNIVLRGLAKDRGLKINEYGVFRGEGPDCRADRGRSLCRVGSALFSAGIARGSPRVRMGPRG